MIAAGNLLLALAVSAQTVPASELLGAFDRLCVASAADRDAALRTADAAGWSSLSGPLLGLLSGQYENAAVRLKQGGGYMSLLVGEHTFIISGHPIKMRTCALSALTPDGDAVEAGVQSRAAVLPSKRLPERGQTEWLFNEQGGTHTSLAQADAATGNAAVVAGSARFLTVSKGVGGAQAVTIVIEAVPTS